MLNNISTTRKAAATLLVIATIACPVIIVLTYFAIADLLEDDQPLEYRAPVAWIEIDGKRFDNHLAASAYARKTGREIDCFGNLR